MFAYFGSRGLYCLDMKGNLKWERDFGRMNKRMTFGEGSSPALYGDKIAVLWDHEGQSYLYILDKKTGKEHYSKQRFEGMGEVYASPAAAKDRVYFIGHKGTMYVIKHGSTFEVLAKNQLDDTFNASPAIVGSDIYLRGYKYLYCISRK